MSKSDDYLYDRSDPVDPDVARLEALLAPLAHDRPLDEVRLRRSRRRAPWIVGAIAVVSAAAVVAIWMLRSSPTSDRTEVACTGDTGFAFTVHGGTAACGGAASSGGVLPIGGVLDTGPNNAQLTIADIGTATLFPGTRVRLDRTEANTRHQLHLERGRMHAIVTAPPRIFAVTTPGTSVIDLGCEYTIEIDERGQGSITVQSGKVELENGAGIAIVAPAGTSARLLAGPRASVPLVETASPELRAAVERLDVDAILGAAGPADAITIVNLAAISSSRRDVILARLAELVPPPPGVTVESAAASTAELERWREDVVIAHLGERMLQGGRKTPQKN